MGTSRPLDILWFEYKRHYASHYSLSDTVDSMVRLTFEDLEDMAIGHPLGGITLPSAFLEAVDGGVSSFQEFMHDASSRNMVDEFVIDPEGVLLEHLGQQSHIFDAWQILIERLKLARKMFQNLCFSSFTPKPPVSHPAPTSSHREAPAPSQSTTSSMGHVTVSRPSLSSPPSSTTHQAPRTAPASTVLKTVDIAVGKAGKEKVREEKRDGEGWGAKGSSTGNLVRIPSSRSGTFAGGPATCQVPQATPPPLPRPPDPLPRPHISHSTVLMPPASTIPPGADPPPISRSSAVSKGKTSSLSASTRPAPTVETIVDDGPAKRTAINAPALSSPTLDPATASSPPAVARMLVNSSATHQAAPATSPPLPRRSDPLSFATGTPRSPVVSPLPPIAPSADSPAIPRPPAPPAAPTPVLGPPDPAHRSETSHSKVLSPQPPAAPGAVSPPITRLSVVSNSLASSVVRAVEGNGRNTGKEKERKEKRGNVGWGAKDHSVGNAALPATLSPPLRPPDPTGCSDISNSPVLPPCVPSLVDLRPICHTISSPSSTHQAPPATSPPLPGRLEASGHPGSSHLPVHSTPPPTVHPGTDSPPILRSFTISNGKILSLLSSTCRAPIAATIMDDGPAERTAGPVSTLSRSTVVPSASPPTASRTFLCGLLTHQATPTMSPPLPRRSDPLSFATGTPRSLVVSPLPPVAPNADSPAIARSSGPTPSSPSPCHSVSIEGAVPHNWSKSSTAGAVGALLRPTTVPPAMQSLCATSRAVPSSSSMRGGPPAAPPPVPGPPDSPRSLQELSQATAPASPPPIPLGVDSPPISRSLAVSACLASSSPSPSRSPPIVGTNVHDASEKGKSTSVAALVLSPASSSSLDPPDVPHSAELVPTPPCIPAHSDPPSFPIQPVVSSLKTSSLLPRLQGSPEHPPDTSSSRALSPSLPAPLHIRSDAVSPPTTRPSVVSNSLACSVFKIIEGDERNAGTQKEGKEKQDFVGWGAKKSSVRKAVHISPLRGGTFVGGLTTCQAIPVMPPSLSRLPDPPRKTDVSVVSRFSPSPPISPRANPQPTLTSLATSNPHESFSSSWTRSVPITEIIVHDRTKVGTAGSIAALSRPIFIYPAVLSPPVASRIIVSGCFANLMPPATPPPPLLSLKDLQAPMTTCTSPNLKAVEGIARNLVDEKEREMKPDDVDEGGKDGLIGHCVRISTPCGGTFVRGPSMHQALAVTLSPLSRPLDASGNLDGLHLPVLEPQPPTIPPGVNSLPIPKSSTISNSTTSWSPSATRPALIAASMVLDWTKSKTARPVTAGMRPTPMPTNIQVPPVTSLLVPGHCVDLSHFTVLSMLPPLPDPPGHPNTSLSSVLLTPLPIRHGAFVPLSPSTSHTASSAEVIVYGWPKTGIMGPVLSRPTFVSPPPPILLNSYSQMTATIPQTSPPFQLLVCQQPNRSAFMCLHAITWRYVHAGGQVELKIIWALSTGVALFGLKDSAQAPTHSITIMGTRAWGAIGDTSHILGLFLSCRMVIIGLPWKPGEHSQGYVDA